MKKIFIALLALSSFVFANATNEEILALYNKNIPQSSGIKLEIVDRKPLPEDNNYELVTLRISKDGISEDDVILIRDNYLINELVNIKTGEPYKAKYQQAMQTKKLANVYKVEDQKNIIKLGDDPKKPTYVIFTDADCPYCRQEMSVIRDRLKDANLEVIMASVHGDDGDAKSALIYKDMKNAKTDEDKIKVFEKYYAPEFKITANDVNATDLENARNLASKYHTAGVNSVPFIVEKSNLIK